MSRPMTDPVHIAQKHSFRKWMLVLLCILSVLAGCSPEQGKGVVSGHPSGSGSKSASMAAANAAWRSALSGGDTVPVQGQLTVGPDIIEAENGTIPATKLLLQQGDNQIRVLSGWGWYEIDSFILTPVPVNPVPSVASDPVDSGASAAARSLMHYLADQYGKFILSGQTDLGNVSWIYYQTGKKPALVALDMMDYSPSRVERGTSSKAVEDAIAWARQGGIVSFQWHWNSPSGLVDQPGKEWYKGFYSNATTFDLATALSSPGSESYNLLLRDMDAIAMQLKRLAEEGIPVLWRPLHEAGGKWFWWGAKGAEPCKALYRLMYQRFTSYHGLHNLIWVWSTPEAAWYPGDDVVDIVGYDSYPEGGDYSPVINRFEQLSAVVGDRKIVAMTENGPIPDPDLLAATGAHWSWFCTWSGFNSDIKQNDPSHVKKVFQHPYVITLDELPDVRNYPY